MAVGKSRTPLGPKALTHTDCDVLPVAVEASETKSILGVYTYIYIDINDIHKLYRYIHTMIYTAKNGVHYVNAYIHEQKTIKYITPNHIHDYICD